MKTENRLIAEFMGALKDANNDYDFEGCDFHFQGCTSTDELLFHNSWDWLMPVIKKIGECEDKPPLTLMELSRALVNCDIAKTYISVIEFIKWYNKEQTNEVRV